MTIRFFVPERPFVKQRPRFGRGRAWTPAETRSAEAAVREYARRALPAGFEPFGGPVRLTLEFRFARPARQSAAVRASPWHTFKNDLDNMAKLVQDALNPEISVDKVEQSNGGTRFLKRPVMWLDDGQVADLRASKLWADDEHPEGTSVCVEALDGFTKT